MGDETAGAFIRRIREEREMSLRQLARKVGISATYLSHIEVDHAPPPGPDKLEKIAAALEIDPIGLLQVAGRWGERAAEALDTRPELRQLFELVFAMEETDVRDLVEDISKKQSVPRGLGGLL